MSDATSRFQRATALIGVPTAIIMILAALLRGKAPSGGASYGDVAAFFGSNHTALRVDGVLTLLVVPLLLVVVSGLRSRATGSAAAHAAGSLAVGAVAVLVTVLAVQNAVFEVTVQHVIGRGDGSAARLLSDVNWMLYPALGVATAVVLVAFGAYAVTSQTLPRWTAWFAGLFAALGLVGTCIAAYDDTSGAGVLGLIAWMATAVWVLVSSLTLLARESRVRSTSGAAAGPVTV